MHTIEAFRDSLRDPQPPRGLSRALRALWLDGAGDWEAAHREVQPGGETEDAWVHAYLHRKEGDLGNARHWYRRAGRDEATGDLAEEWLQLGRALLGQRRGEDVGAGGG